MLGVAEARRRLAQQPAARQRRGGRHSSGRCGSGDPARPARTAARRGDGRRSSSPARPTWQRRQPDTAGAVAARPGRHGSGPARPARQRGRYGAGYNNGGATRYTRRQLRRRTGDGAAADSEDWSLRPDGRAHPAEPRHSPVRRGTQGKHGWLGRRQWRQQ